jgi:serine/threonine protein phosphatase 1
MGQHTFAIGDVHGRADLLELLLTAIGRLATNGQFTHRIVFLGDIIDRGPDSAAAMAAVVRTLKELPESRLILGNHDWFPIRILDELAGEQREMALEHWICKMGGYATLTSYGCDPETFEASDLERCFPSEHLDVFRSAERYVELPSHLLVHAGIAPGIPLEAQTAYDLMWIKEPFLSSAGSFGKTVVHGHTVTESLYCEVTDHRIAVDTGAYASGRLSAAWIDADSKITLLHAEADGKVTVGVQPVRLRAAA